MHAPAPPRAIAYAAPRIACKQAADGSLRYRSIEPLAPHDASLARLFRAAVERNPDGLFLAERGADRAWRKLPYAAARRAVDALAHGLIERGLSAQRPVMILSGNGIDHALVTLAGHTAGIAVAPISVAYSLQSEDHAKLKHIAALLEPGLVYVADTAPSPRRSPRSRCGVSSSWRAATAPSFPASPHSTRCCRAGRDRQ